LEREAAKVGLKINEQKTKYMIAARNDRTIRDVGQSMAIGDKHFEVVKEFVYLGSLMTPTNDVSLEIQLRIQTTNRCFFGLRKHLQSSHLSRQTKFTIHKTLILEFIVLILYFMRLQSLKHEQRYKIVLNSKWRQNPRWMPKFVFDIASTEFHLFQNAFLRSFYFAIAQLL
jgi:hypothetical protein